MPGSAGTSARSCRCAVSVPGDLQGPEDTADGGCADPVAELEQLAFGSSGIPAVVLCGEPQVRSQPPRQEPDQCGHHRLVEPRPVTGPAQHSDLMSQHQELGVLGSRRPAGQDQPGAEPDEDEVQQALGHG
jgi:hypothetical protein